MFAPKMDEDDVDYSNCNSVNQAMLRGGKGKGGKGSKKDEIVNMEDFVIDQFQGMVQQQDRIIADELFKSNLGLVKTQHLYMQNQQARQNIE